MKFSIIIPSYNQPQYIEQTFKNVAELKLVASQNGHEIEALILDSCSVQEVQDIIKKYNSIFDYIDISKDNGQYDAINKGITKATGDYWAWLNTDDLIDVNGFVKLTNILKTNSTIDYIYGGVRHINEAGNFIRDVNAKHLSLNDLVNDNSGIYQPCSFFRKKFTDKIGLLEKYNCCFDYEYILRILSNNGKIYACDFIVASFRLHDSSKTGSIIPVFMKEQLEISKKYGRNFFSKHTLIANLRLLKHRYFKNKE